MFFRAAAVYDGVDVGDDFGVFAAPDSAKFHEMVPRIADAGGVLRDAGDDFGARCADRIDRL